MQEHVFSATISVFTVMMAGGFIRWLGWIKPEADRSITTLMVNVLYPCLVFEKMSSARLIDMLDTMWLVPIIGFFLIILGILLTRLVCLLPRNITGLSDSSQKKTFTACVSMFNYGFLPIPLVLLFYKENAAIMLSVLFIFNIGVEMAMWSLVIPNLAAGEKVRWWQNIITVPFMALIIAIIGNLIGLPAIIPAPIIHAFSWLGAANIPISLVMIGAVAWDELSRHDSILGIPDSVRIIFWSCFLRLGLIPACIIYLATFLHAYPLLQQIMIIQAAMPCATFFIIYSRMYGGTPSVALRAVISTSLVALGTLCIWIPLGFHFCGIHMM